MKKTANENFSICSLYTYLLLIFIKIAIAKNTNKTPITIKAIFIIFVMVEVFDADTLETLLTFEDVLVWELEEELVIFELEELLLVKLLELDEFSVTFKSIA